MKENPKKSKDLVLGQSVYCDVWELLSALDNEGIIMAIDGDMCTVKFYSRILKLNKSALTPR